MITKIIRIKKKLSKIGPPDFKKLSDESYEKLTEEYLDGIINGFIQILKRSSEIHLENIASKDDKSELKNYEQKFNFDF